MCCQRKATCDSFPSADCPDETLIEDAIHTYCGGFRCSINDDLRVCCESIEEAQQGEAGQGGQNEGGKTGPEGPGMGGGLRRALESTLNNDHSFACSTCPIGKRNKHFCCQHDLVLQIQRSLIPFFQFF